MTIGGFPTWLAFANLCDLQPLTPRPAACTRGGLISFSPVAAETAGDAAHAWVHE